VSTASIVVFAQHGVVPLRATLHALRETAGRPHESVVVASQCGEQVAIYLSREYFRRHIAGYVLDTLGPEGSHCRLDRAFHLVRGEYLVRVDDGLTFAAGWLGKVVAALDADPDIGWLSLFEPPLERRPRGRPRKPTGRPEIVEHASDRCFATRRSLFARHEYELMGEQEAECCLYQRHLKRIHKKIAQLPGLVEASPVTGARAQNGAVVEDDLPAHEGATGAMQRLQQTCALGDDILMTCMACGATELEVLAARIKFCAAHQVAIGHLYEFRCPECHELHYKDDLQSRCPDAT
jgi:hypothetical protein